MFHVEHEVPLAGGCSTWNTRKIRGPLKSASVSMFHVEHEQKLWTVASNSRRTAPMLVFATGRWVLARALRSPLAIVTAALAALVVPGMLHLSPWLESHGHGPAERMALEWLAPLGVVGFAYGLWTLSRGEAFLLRFGARSRFWGLVGGLLAPALGLQIVMLAGGLLQGGSWHPARVLTHWTAVDAYLVVLGLLVFATGWSPQARLGLFLGITWLLPSLVADGGLLGRVSAPLAGPLLSRESMGPFVVGQNSAFPWLIGQAVLAAAAWLFLVPGKAPRA